MILGIIGVSEEVLGIQVIYLYSCQQGTGIRSKIHGLKKVPSFEASPPHSSDSSVPRFVIYSLCSQEKINRDFQTHPCSAYVKLGVTQPLLVLAAATFAPQGIALIPSRNSLQVCS